MLILTRAVGETLRIGDDIEVRVVAVGKDGVRLAVVAPQRLLPDVEEAHERAQRADDGAVARAHINWR